MQTIYIVSARGWWVVGGGRWILLVKIAIVYFGTHYAKACAFACFVQNRVFSWTLIRELLPVLHKTIPKGLDVQNLSFGTYCNGFVWVLITMGRMHNFLHLQSYCVPMYTIKCA